MSNFRLPMIDPMYDLIPTSPCSLAPGLTLAFKPCFSIFCTSEEHVPAPPFRFLAPLQRPYMPSLLHYAGSFHSLARAICLALVYSLFFFCLRQRHWLSFPPFEISATTPRSFVSPLSRFLSHRLQPSCLPRVCVRFGLPIVNFPKIHLFSKLTPL